jgi:hypothetical protein
MNFDSTTVDRSGTTLRRVTNRRQQACSFCRSPGHNIIRCNDDRLTDFEACCLTQLRVFESHNSDTRQLFQNWLIETRVTNSENQHLLKSFAIKKCRAVSGTDILTCVIYITEYIYTTYNLRENIYINHGNGLNNSITRLNISAGQLNSTTGNTSTTGLTQFINENNARILNQIENHNEINNQINLLHLDIARELLYALVYQDSVNRYNEQEIINKKFNISLLLDTNNDIKENTNSMNENKNSDCNICLENKENSTFVRFGCKHEFCKECVVQCLKNDRRAEPCCALCRAEIKTCKTSSREIYEELLKIMV